MASRRRVRFRYGSFPGRDSPPVPTAVERLVVAGAPSRRPPADGCHHRQVVSPVVVTALTVSCALVTAVVWLTGLSKVPEPADGDDSEVKVPYAALARPRIAALVAVLSAAAAWVAASHVPTAALPPWLVLSTLGVALAAVDGFTTWIPARPTRWTWLVMAAAGASSAAAGGRVGQICSAWWSAP